MPNIFDYTDYRRFLRDWLEAKKGRPSLRGLAKKVGCSPSLLSSVIGATRGLTLQLADTLADATSLDVEEKAQFLALVEWQEGTTLKQRRAAAARANAARRFRAMPRIDDALSLVFSRWHYVPVLELVRCTGFREDPEWIAATLVPAVTVEEAREALELLLELGFLARDTRGRLGAAEPSWTTGHEASTPASPDLRTTHLSLLTRASTALEQVPKAERYFGTISVALTDEAFAEMKKEVAKFEEDLVVRYSTCENPTRVYQVAIQLFPVSKKG